MPRLKLTPRVASAKAGVKHKAKPLKRAHDGLSDSESESSSVQSVAPTLRPAKPLPPVASATSPPFIVIEYEGDDSDSVASSDSDYSDSREASSVSELSPTSSDDDEGGSSTDSDGDEGESSTGSESN